MIVSINTLDYILSDVIKLRRRVMLTLPITTPASEISSLMDYLFAPGALPVFTGCAQGLFSSSAIVTPDERCVCATSGAKNHA